jgi:hypothetical protein
MNMSSPTAAAGAMTGVLAFLKPSVAQQYLSP